MENKGKFILSKNLKIKIYKTIILPVVLYGCEAWSLTLREECRLRVFENRRIFGTKRDQNGKWRRLHNEELIRMDLKEIGINTRNWVDPPQDRDYWRALVNAALNLRVP